MKNEKRHPGSPVQRIYLDGKLFEYPVCGETIIKMFREIKGLEELSDYLKEERSNTWNQLQESWKEIGVLKARLEEKLDIISKSGVDKQNQLDGVATWKVIDNEIDINNWAWTFNHRTKVCNEFLLQTHRKERFIDPLSWPSVDIYTDYQIYNSYYECN